MKGVSVEKKRPEVSLNELIKAHEHIAYTMNNKSKAPKMVVNISIAVHVQFATV